MPVQAPRNFLDTLKCEKLGMALDLVIVIIKLSCTGFQNIHHSKILLFIYLHPLSKYRMNSQFSD